MKLRPHCGLLVTTPVFIAAGTFANNSGDATPGLPAGIQADDILMLIVQSVGTDPDPAAPAGYALITKAETVSGTSLVINVFWKRATASESAPTVIDTGDHQCAQILAFRGCTPIGNPWDDTNTNTQTATTAVSISGATTTGPLRLIVAIAGTSLDANSTTEFSGWTNANLVSITEITDQVGNSNLGGGFGAAAGVKTLAGAVGTTTATSANSNTHANICIALKGFGSS